MERQGWQQAEKLSRDGNIASWSPVDQSYYFIPLSQHLHYLHFKKPLLLFSGLHDIMQNSSSGICGGFRQ
jgi:hypothetical protein